MRRLPLLTMLALPLALSACGTGPAPEPNVGRPELDPSGEPYAFPNGGSIDLPASWNVEPAEGEGPEIVRATSGRGQVVVWQYARSEPLPSTRRDLRNTRRSLRAAIESRDATFREDAALLRRVPQPAIEIAGVGRIVGAQRFIRSLHVYANGTETVVDCIGPTSGAATFDQTICNPVIDSLQLP